jgi:hypothetical protein
MTPLKTVHFLLPRRVVVNQRTVVVKTPVRVFSIQGERSREGWRASPVSMPFTLALIRRRFEAVLDRWLRLYEQLRFPLELFFSVHNSQGGLLEYRFLSLVQAAESYHRERVRSDELTPTEFRKRLALLRGRTPKRYRPWLNERLHNRMSLRARLDALIARTGPTFHALVPDQKKVVDAIVKARNGLSHGQLGFQPAFEGDYGLFRLIEVVSLLLQEQLLRELGFSRLQAGAALERNWKYAYAKRLVPKVDP